MKPRERILSIIRGKMADKLPFFHVDHQLPRGEKEREARDRGMGVICYRPCYLEFMSNVEIVTKRDSNTLVRTYNTPVGKLTEVLVHGAGYGIAGFDRDWRGVLPRRKEFLVKTLEDYKVLRFMVENIHYKPYYFPVEDQRRRLGEDGVVVSDIPYEPLQRLLIEWVDWKRFYTDMTKNREIIDEIFELLEMKYEEELFPIAANSPSDIVRYGGNIDSTLVSPSMFERYYVPSYAKCAMTVKNNGKVLDVHMDGRLKFLADAIAKSQVDIVEALTPPPMGDIPVNEALSIWKDKIIWINIPSTISTLPGSSPHGVKKYLVEQLKLLIPGERAIVIASTENRVPEENLIAMTDVMERATLPLSRESVEKIRIDMSAANR